MLIKSDSASVSAIKATLNNAHFILIATNCGRHWVLLVSKWTHRYLLKRDSLLPSISFKEIPETRKQEILLLRISFVNHFVLLTLNFRFVILKRSTKQEIVRRTDREVWNKLQSQSSACLKVSRNTTYYYCSYSKQYFSTVNKT